MKVFLATLFFVGFAAAAPCPILENLKIQLEQGVQDLRVQTETSIQSILSRFEEGIAAFVKNPSTGFDILKEVLNDVTRTVFYDGTDTINELVRVIRTAISELKKDARCLVKVAVYPILDNLLEQLIRNVSVGGADIVQLLEKVRQLLEEDFKVLVSDPAQAPKIQEKGIGNLFVDQRMEYARKTEQLVQDTLNAIEKLYL